MTADCDYETEDHPATCTTGAYTTYTCKDCGYTYDGEAGQPNGHTYGGWASNNDGTHTRTCSVCAEGTDGHTVTADCDYDETPHAATCVKGSYVTYVCKDCGYTCNGAEADDKLAHELTCTPNGDGTHTTTCANCDYSETEAHVDGDPVIENEVAATCDTAGSYDTVVYCAGCGAELSRESHTVTKDHTPAQPVKENEVAVTCTTDGSYDIVVYCADCGAELSREAKTVTAAGHKWDNGVTTAATCTAEGRTVYTCKTCGETRTETTAINPDNHVGGTEVRGKVEATKDQDGYTGDTYCKGCGQLLKEGHSVSYEDGYCPYCGGHHTGVLGALITALHGILWLFRKAFGLL